MNTHILWLGLLVGTANFLFRYLPLRLRIRQHATPTKNSLMSRLLDSIGIASICALLVVSSLPDIMHNSSRIMPTLIGFGLLAITFYQTRSIIFSTLLSALGYGVTWKILMVAT